MSSQSQSDAEETENTGSNSACPETVKQELDSKEEQTVEDIFSNDIMIPRANPVSMKERRESKEKSKKELEEEEREKMQYVFVFVLYVQFYLAYYLENSFENFYRVLVSNFTEDQLDRYEMYRRAAFPKAAIKRVLYLIFSRYLQNSRFIIKKILRIY